MNLATVTCRNHNTYGGEITPFDFDGHHTLSTMSARIASDLRFDEQCRKNIEAKERMKKNA